MMMYREPLDEFLKPINMRLPYAHPHPEAMKVSIRHSFEAIRPSMSRLLDDIQEQYRRGIEAREVERGFMDEVRANGNSWDGLDQELYFAATTTKQASMLECEILSEALLMAFDTIITFVVTELTSRETCLDLGEPTSHGVPLDRLLDAIANFIRHRYEWRRQHFLGEPYDKFQGYSIEPLARAFTGQALFGNDAVKAVLEIPMPATAALDIVGNFETNGLAFSYQFFEERVRMLCDRIVDAKFATWFNRFLEREKQKQVGPSSASP